VALVSVVGLQRALDVVDREQAVLDQGGNAELRGLQAPPADQLNLLEVLDLDLLYESLRACLFLRKARVRNLSNFDVSVLRACGEDAVRRGAPVDAEDRFLTVS